MSKGRYLDFRDDLTGDIRSSILNGYERRVGRDKEATDTFFNALHAAESDRNRRYMEERRRPHHGRS